MGFWLPPPRFVVIGRCVGALSFFLRISRDTHNENSNIDFLLVNEEDVEGMWVCWLYRYVHI